MKRIETNLWYGGKGRAVSFSYDDGRYEDKRLVELMNKYGIKGTFHLCNPGFLESNGYKIEPLVDPAEYEELYKGHEISCHMEHHPFPKWQPDEAIRAEITHNKAFLESLCKYPVRGMSYPFSNYDARVIAQCRAAGMEYARTVNQNTTFSVPDDFMSWHPTCHHFEVTDELAEKFFSPMNYDYMRLLYAWGHSYEMNSEEKWVQIEEVFKRVAGREDVWYATSIEIYDYIQAVRNLKFSCECSCVYNPSATDVWIKADFQPIKIPAGATVQID